MSMNELLKIVRYSNLFDLNHLMDAIDSINDEIRTSVNNNEETTNQANNNKELFLLRGKNYRGRLSKKFNLDLFQEIISVFIGLDENIATKAHHAQVTEGKISIKFNL
jgi:hypothetical protein